MERAAKGRKAVESEEAKLRKELRKAERWGKGGDVALLQHRLREASLGKEVAQRQLSETLTEQEVVKMFRYALTNASLFS